MTSTCFESIWKNQWLLKNYWISKGTEEYLGGGNSNIFYFHPGSWGRWTHFDEHIFQMGWFNHQPDMLQFLWCPFKGILIFFSPKPAPFMCLRASSKTQQNPKVSDTIDIYNLQSLSDLDAPLSFEPAGLFIYMYAYNICIYYIYIYIYVYICTLVP